MHRIMLIRALLGGKGSHYHLNVQSKTGSQRLFEGALLLRENEC